MKGILSGREDRAVLRMCSYHFPLPVSVPDGLRRRSCDLQSARSRRIDGKPEASQQHPLFHSDKGSRRCGQQQSTGAQGFSVLHQQPSCKFQLILKEKNSLRRKSPFQAPDNLWLLCFQREDRLPASKQTLSGWCLYSDLGSIDHTVMSCTAISFGAHGASVS